MFNSSQKKRLDTIRLSNMFKGNSLLQLSLEEVAEYQLAAAKYNMNEVDKIELLEEGVDSLITISNFLNQYFRSEDIKNTINRKLSKAEKILNIK